MTSAARRATSNRFGGALLQTGKLARTLARAGHFWRLGPAYLNAWFRLNRPLGREAISFGAFVGLCTAHWHLFKMAREPQKGAFGTILPMPADVAKRSAAA